MSLPTETCDIYGVEFTALSAEDLNKQLYHHGVDNHLGDLRRAAPKTDETTDPIWVADYVSGSQQ